MKKITIAFIWLLAIGMFACNPVRITNSYSAKNLDFGQYRTFDFTEDGQTGASSFASEQTHVVRQEITRQLEKRGLTHSTANPDLLVDLEVTVEDKVQTRETNLMTEPLNYIGQRRFTWQSREVPVGRYQQGTVTVNLVDRERNKLIWQGEAEGVLPANAKRLQRAIAEGGDKLFSQLPAQEVN
jgi:hypothetical protein